MPLGSLTPNMMTEDINNTIKFYTQILNFEIVATAPEAAPFDWMMLQNGECSLMFQTRPSLTEEIPTLADRAIGATLTLYINVSDAKDWHDQLQGRVQFVQELHTAFYGATEFGILDNNGYILVFAQPAS